MDRFLIPLKRKSKSNKEMEADNNVTVEINETNKSGSLISDKHKGAGGNANHDAVSEPGAEKRRKVRALEDKNCKFQEKWTDEFFFVLKEISMKPVCLICQQTGSAFKCSNLERHHTTVHAGFSEKYPPGSNLRKNKIEQLAASFKSQQKIIKKSSSIAECLTEASFEIACILACHKKAFTDAEIVKECFLASAEILCADFNNKNATLKQIKGLQLSDTTVMRRVEETGKDIWQQLMADLSAAPCFSLALDETFQCKITTLFIPDLCSNCFVHFPKLKSVTLDNPDLLKHYQYKSFVHILEELRKEFESRFKDIMEYKELFNFIENPFHTSVSSLSPVLTDLGADRAKVESEIVELQMDDIMKSELKAGVYHFWNMVPDLQYSALKQCAQKVLSIFVSTYTCESTFSTMNIVKRKQRNKLTNEHLDCLTRIARTDYKYCMKKVKEQQLLMAFRKAVYENEWSINNNLGNMNSKDSVNKTNILLSSEGYRRPGRSNGSLGQSQSKPMIRTYEQMQRSNKIQACDSVVKLSRYVLMKAFGSTMAQDILPLNKCSQHFKMRKIQDDPLKVIQVNVKPQLLYQVLTFLNNLGVLTKEDQENTFSVLRRIEKTSELLTNPSKNPYEISRVDKFNNVKKGKEWQLFFMGSTSGHHCSELHKCVSNLNICAKCHYQQVHAARICRIFPTQTLPELKHLLLTIIKDNCPDTNTNLLPWNPGHNEKKRILIRRGLSLRLESSATVHSIVIEERGKLIFQDKPGKTIILRARYILIRSGGGLHIGSGSCPYNSTAIISLYGKSTEEKDVENFGKKFIGVDKGGILELHGKKPLSWTLLDRTLYPGGLQYGSYKFEKYWGSRGINIRIIDEGTAHVLVSERFDTHLMLNESRRLREFLNSQPPGRIVAIAVGDSAARGLTTDTRQYVKETLRSKYIGHLGYRQPWALVGTLGGSIFSVTEDKRQYNGNGSTGTAVARRDFQAYDGTIFTVTAYSEWVKGVPHSGFQVEVSRGIVLDLADDATSWLPGNRIVIASTDYSMYQAEEFNLLPCPECRVNQVKIYGNPLYLHMGEVVDGIDMRAEVGLLSRNILIKGEMESSCYGQNNCQFFKYDTFGGQIKIQRNFGSVHMSGVELSKLGQQILGSYPVHFHLAGDVDQKGGYDPQTYLNNLAIHHCFSRCIAIHGTNGLLINDTIGYDTLGHCFFLEDGVKQRNTFYHNLGLLTKPGTILPTDRNETMCLALRNNVYGNYTPVPSTDCMAVSTFWIANPNNNLINNAAAGAQDVGIWFIFHRVPTGLSKGKYPEGQAEFTPLGIFYNNRAHSNFKAGLFIGKGIKTTKASAENPREYLTVDIARFHPHQDANPEKSRVPAIIDGLIAFKNNDHGAWARGGDIVFRNSGFSDNGIGLTLASDGTFPTDEGSSLEVRESIFVGESNNVGCHGGLNNYWGKGANREYRTLPRNKTFPVRGFQIYDGPVRLMKCTFKKFTPTADRYSSAIGFFMKNSWQISPQNNISQTKMERSVGLKVFFGKAGQWFGTNDYDGDKTSIFHDLDGSVTGYQDVFVARADNYLVRHPGCLTIPRWNAVLCNGKYAQLYIQARRPENLVLSVAREIYPSYPLRLQGVNRGALYQQYQPAVMLQQAYILHWDGRAPEEVILYPINFNRGDWIQVALCYPKGTTFKITSDINQRQTGKVHSVEYYVSATSLETVLNSAKKKLYYFDNKSGYLFLHVQAQYARKGHSYCSKHGCERVKITAHMIPKDPWACSSNPFPKSASMTQVKRLSVSERATAPCSHCGAPQVAISSDPSRKYIRIQIQSLIRTEPHNKPRAAFIKVNDEVFLFKQRGLFFVVIDACSGNVVSRRHFDTVRAPWATEAITRYIKTAVKDRSIILVCSRDATALPTSPGISVFIKLGSAKPIYLFNKGSFAMLGYKGLVKPSWVKICNRGPGLKSASLQHYVPLKLTEYKCSSVAKENRKAAKVSMHLFN
ncbi:inactive cell surface hyaluronidase CEMIP2-like [Latimeria chalumnae]|uniref:inactive cell surface hyaluronidase CEMIP2-like n=1 Tax=Latimeria chalumnae TaxID=7897 RepID=UPI00313D8AB8